MGLRLCSPLAGSIVLIFSAGLAAWGCVGDEPDIEPSKPSDDGGAHDTDSSRDDTGSPPGDAGGDADAAQEPECDPTKPFAAAIPVPGVNHGAAIDEHAVLTADERVIFFGSNRQASDKKHIYFATRGSRSEPFSTPTLVQGLYSNDGETRPSVSPTATLLVLDSFEPVPGADGVVHLFLARRASAAVDFPGRTAIAGDYLQNGGLTSDESAIYAENLSTGKIVRLPKNGATYGPAEPLANVAATYTATSPVSADDLTLYVASGQPGTRGGSNIWVHKRTAKDQAYGAATELSSISTDGDESPSWISPDGCRLYLSYQAPSANNVDLYVATRPK